MSICQELLIPGKHTGKQYFVLSLLGVSFVGPHPPENVGQPFVPHIVVLPCGWISVTIVATWVVGYSIYSDRIDGHLFGGRLG